ncbi:MAG TPA: hypothetical protein VGC42_11735 [Kofleriaceae bacterium]
MATFASYLLAVIGFVMMAMAVAQTFGSSLRYMYTRPLLINALRTSGNQAEQLCKSEPDTYFGAIGAAIKTAAMIQTRDLKTLQMATGASYDASSQAIVGKWKTLIGKVKMALMAAGGAILVGASSGFPPILVLILGVVVGIGFLRLYLFKQEIESCIVRARAEILPEVDQSFAAGRYVYPPQR